MATDTQNNPGGTNYTVLHPGNTSDLFGGQQQCNSSQDFWKALTALKPGTGHLPSIQSFHDALAYLGSMISAPVGTNNVNDSVMLSLMPPMVKEAGYNNSEMRQTFGTDVWDDLSASMTADDHNTAVISGTGTFFFPFKKVLPRHLYRAHDGSGAVDVGVPIPNVTFLSLRGASAAAVKTSINTAMNNTEFLAFSPMMDSESGVDISLFRDTNADNQVEFVGDEYNKHLMFLLLKTYFSGLKTSTGVGTTTSFSVNPFGISLVAGASFDNRLGGIRRYLGRENSANESAKFNLDEFLAVSLFTGADLDTKMGKYMTYVASLSGSEGRTKFSEDVRVSNTYFSMPIIVPVTLNWSGGYLR